MIKEHNIKINQQACIGCGLCIKDCPTNNLNITDKKAVVNSQNCIKCGHCVAICPKEAVSITGFPQPPMKLDGSPCLDTQQLLYALRSRRSIRQFTKQSVAQDVIDNILEAGRWTPTAKNAPSISYLVLQQQRDTAQKLALSCLKKLLPLVSLVNSSAKNSKIDDEFFFKGAPLAIAIVSQDKVSASLAAANMALMAESQGLGVLYSGFFSMAANMSSPLRKLLRLKGKDKVVTTLVLGYSAVNYCRTTQKDTVVVTYL